MGLASLTVLSLQTKIETIGSHSPSLNGFLLLSLECIVWSVGSNSVGFGRVTEWLYFVSRARQLKQHPIFRSLSYYYTNTMHTLLLYVIFLFYYSSYHVFGWL